ncbi:MAG: hybrid sensor histidine kinase/response regulator [Opitutae bacterium]|nr:hybrid sensor histidine kinase/response regulator [Opitutae bacterium]
MTTTTAPATATLPTLLIVDDEEGPRHSLRMVFKQDFNIHAVDTGDKALEFAKGHPIQLAILDIRMAGKTGIDVLRGLKAIDPHVEVIMLTAYETIETARQALRLGACDYLSKPFDLSTIREAVTRALHLRRISETVSSTSERLQALTEQLNDTALKEEMSRTTTEIYAGALHDINNPLTVITGYVELLRHRLDSVGSLHGADLQAVRDDVNLLSKQVSTCSAITRRYLRFVNKRSSHAPEVSVNQVLDDVQTLMRNHPSLRGGQLAVKHLDRDTAGQIGGTELIQILLNLTVNAFQSTEKPQTVWITAERYDRPLPLESFRDTADERFIGLESFGNSVPLVGLSVLDQGPGIPRDVLSRIFEPYFTTKTHTGTGLGLAIVTRLVRHHHGLVHVKTRLGEGTRFSIYLPGKEPSNSSSPFGS